YNTGWIMNFRGQSWKFNAGDGSNRVDVNADAPSLSDGKWHSVTITVKKGGAVKLYQDDSLYAFGSVAGIKAWNNSGDVKMVTGDDSTGSYRRTHNDYFLVTNIRIWHTVLALNDMKKYISACDTTFNPTDPFNKNLGAWWRANDGSGHIFKDYGP